MAEIIQCPACLLWLNMELRETVLVGVLGSTLVYKCQKCGAEFTEHGEVIKTKEAGR